MVACVHKKMFILKGIYVYGEPKNGIFGWVQKPFFSLRDSKLPAFMHRRIVLRMEIEEIWGYISIWYCVCTKAMFILKGSYGCGEPKNVIIGWGQKTVPPVTGQSTTRFHASPYRADNVNIPNLGTTFRLGTVFAPRQCLR